MRRFCKVRPPVSQCRDCVDTWETMSGDISQAPDCKKCAYGKEYEIVDFHSNFWGTFAIVLVDGKPEKVSISRIYDCREIEE